MQLTDKKDFGEAMTSCFQNFRANINKDMINEWFEELKQFPFYNVKKAFIRYTNEVEKFPPTRATIVKFSKIQFGIDKSELNYNLGCIRMMGDRNCGKEIFVQGHCEKCYDEVRPKNDVEKMFDEALRLNIEKAKTEGSVSEREISDWSRKQLRLSPLGKIFLKNYENQNNDFYHSD